MKPTKSDFYYKRKFELEVGLAPMTIRSAGIQNVTHVERLVKRTNDPTDTTATASPGSNLWCRNLSEIGDK